MVSTQKPSKDFAVVTGAGSGIGRALAIELSSEPLTVVAVGRREEPLKKTARMAPGCVLTIAADVGNATQCSRILDEFGEPGSRVKYLIHTAGACRIEPVADITLESWRRIMATNVDGRLFLTLQLLPWLKAGSRVLFVGSNSATTPRKGSTAYCVSKAASYMLQECLKLELSKEGVLVTSAVPSPVDTPLLLNQICADPNVFPDAVEYRRLQEEGKLISPLVVARFYRWLLTRAPEKDYAACQWNIQNQAHHRFWLGNESLYQ